MLTGGFPSESNELQILMSKKTNPSVHIKFLWKTMSNCNTGINIECKDYNGHYIYKAFFKDVGWSINGPLFY